MPKNKKESLIFTVLMCFAMVFWMSLYNVALQIGEISLDVVAKAWMGFPFAYVAAILCDWFLVSRLAKALAFRYFVKPDSHNLKKAVAVSICMVIPMVIIMSLYGAVEGCTHTGAWKSLLIIWLLNIPKNFAMALPFQLLIAGPCVRFIFRKCFPEGCVL